MTKCWLIPFLIAGLFGDKAFADCLPAPDTPASVIEHFQRFNKPLPERFCSKEAAPQASHEPSQESSQAEEAPDQYGDDDGRDDGPSAQYEDDPGGGYESDHGGGYEGDQEGSYEGDQEGGYEWDQEQGPRVMSGTKTTVTRVTRTMRAATIGKMTTRAIKAASIGRAVASTGKAMASANPHAKKPT